MSGREVAWNLHNGFALACEDSRTRRSPAQGSPTGLLGGPEARLALELSRASDTPMHLEALCEQELIEAIGSRPGRPRRVDLSHPARGGRRGSATPPRKAEHSGLVRSKLRHQSRRRRPARGGLQSPSGEPNYRYFAGRIIARHICATGLLSNPRPSSGWRKLRPIMSVNSSSSTCTLGSNE